MGKPTKKNIRRKNRRTRRKVNKKKMKKGGVSFGINRQFGMCHIVDEKELKYTDSNKNPITGKYSFVNKDKTKKAQIVKICRDSQNNVRYIVQKEGERFKKSHPNLIQFMQKYKYYLTKPDVPDTAIEYKFDGTKLVQKLTDKMNIFSFFRGKK